MLMHHFGHCYSTVLVLHRCTHDEKSRVTVLVLVLYRRKRARLLAPLQYCTGTGLRVRVVPVLMISYLTYSYPCTGLKLTYYVMYMVCTFRTCYYSYERTSTLSLYTGTRTETRTRTRTHSDDDATCFISNSMHHLDCMPLTYGIP